MWNMCMYILCKRGANMYALISIVDVRSAAREQAIVIGIGCHCTSSNLGKVVMLVGIWRRQCFLNAMRVVVQPG